MSQLVSNMILLMIAALLIGWFIGWFLRREATRKKYIREIEDLTDQNNSLTSELHANSVEYENNTKNLEHTNSKLSFANQKIKDYSTKNLELTSSIENFHISQKKLEADLAGIGGKIKNSLNELDILNLQKDEILESKDKITKYEQNINAKTIEIETINENVSLLASEKESLNAKISNENSKISLKEQEINAENDKIKVIEDEFAAKRLEIQDSFEESRRKALNYQYAVNYINEKIEAKETVPFDVIDNIINKNEEKGLFTNLIKKLFGKSTQYIKGGK